MVGWNSSKQAQRRSSRSLIGDNALPFIEPREPAIVLSRVARDFELMPRHLKSLPIFRGRTHENPLSFIREFTSMVATMPFSRLSTEDRCMVCFPHRLEGEAKIWYLDLAPRSLKTWEMVCTKFMSRYYSPERTRELRRQIINFEQTESENLHGAWERFKSLERECPHHNFPQGVLLSFFLDSLFLEDANQLDVWAGGDFGKLTPEEGRSLLEELSEGRRQMSEQSREERECESSFELRRDDEYLALKNELEELRAYSSNLGYSPKPKMIPIEEEEESTYRPELAMAAQDSEEDDEVDDEFDVPNEIPTKYYECPLFEEEDSPKEEEALAVDRWEVEEEKFPHPHECPLYEDEGYPSGDERVDEVEELSSYDAEVIGEIEECQMDEIGNEFGKRIVHEESAFAKSKTQLEQIITHLKDMASNLALLKADVELLAPASFVLQKEEEKDKPSSRFSHSTPVLHLGSVVDEFEYEQVSSNTENNQGDTIQMVEDPIVGVDKASWNWHEQPDEPELIWEIERCNELLAPVLELKVEPKPLFDRSRARENEYERFERQIPRPVAIANEEHSRDSRFPKSPSNNLTIFRLTRRHVDAILLLKIVEIDRGASSMDLIPSRFIVSFALLVF